MQDIKSFFKHESSVDIVESISYEDFYKQYLSQLKPVIIKKGINNLPAVGKWNFDYLQEKIGDKKVKLDHHHNAQFEWSMQEFFEQLSDDNYKGPERYLTQANIAQYFPELMDDVKPYPAFGLPDWKCNPLLPKNMFYKDYLIELLMGKQGTGFFLHYDRGFMNAFVAQVYGEKEVILMHPDDKQYLYPREDEPARSNVDVWNLDLQAYPEAAKASPFFYTLKPGNLVYIPAGWWHTTRNKTQSIGVTFNSINKGNWKLFSNFMVDNYRNSDSAKYPTFVLSTLLNIVYCFENIRHCLFGAKPRLGRLKKIWN